jgi:hypothetical protein
VKNIRRLECVVPICAFREDEDEDEDEDGDGEGGWLVEKGV